MTSNTSNYFSPPPFSSPPPSRRDASMTYDYEPPAEETFEEQANRIRTTVPRVEKSPPTFRKYAPYVPRATRQSPANDALRKKHNPHEKKVHTAEKKNTAYKSPDRTEEQPGKPPLTFEEMREREKTRVPPYFRSNF